jgi:stage V sporulation protein B
LLATVAPTALNVFYGPNYVSGATALSILAISIIILTLFTLVTTTLTAIGKTKQVLQINLVSAFSAVVLLLSLVPLFGIIGAAITRLVVQAISLMIAAYILKRYVSVQLDREALWKSAIASIITIPFLFVLESRMTKGFPVAQVLAIEILVAGLIYVASLYVLKALNSQDFDLLRQFLPKPFSKVIDVLQSVMSRK